MMDPDLLERLATIAVTLWTEEDGIPYFVSVVGRRGAGREYMGTVPPVEGALGDCVARAARGFRRRLAWALRGRRSPPIPPIPTFEITPEPPS